MKANDNRTIEFEGKAYTGYEATQMQRKIETAIRHSKDATNLFKASGDTVGRLAEQGKLNALVDKYSAFSKQAGLRVKKERMSVSGYRPVKASLIDKEEYTELIKKIGINNAPKTLDIYHQIKYNKTKEYDLLQNFSKYKSTVPSATLRQYELYAELKELKLIKGTVVPYESHHAYILEDLSHKRDPSHIMKRMKERHITDDEVQKYVDNALFVEQQFKGTRLVYYSQYGVTVLTKTSDYVGINWIAKTVWNKTDFDANTYKILEVGRKHAK